MPSITISVFCDRDIRQGAIKIAPLNPKSVTQIDQFPIAIKHGL